MECYGPELQMMRNLVSPKTYRLACKYYLRGHIKRVERIDDDLEATIKVRNDIYTNIVLAGTNMSMGCSCKSRHDECCEHMMTLLLFVYDKCTREGIEWQKSFRDTSEIDEEYLSCASMVREYLDRHSDFHDMISPAAMSREFESGKSAGDGCRKILENLYRKSADKKGRISEKNKIRFEAIDMMAKRYEDMDSTMKAIEMYQHTAEYISEHIDIVENTKHHYTGQIYHSLRRIVDLVRKLKMPDQEKQEYMGYLFGRYLHEDTPRFAAAYRDTMYEIARGDKEFEYCASLFESHIDKPPEDGIRRSRVQILRDAFIFMEKTGGSMVPFLEKYHMEDAELCTKYIWNMAETDIEDALKITHTAEESFADPERFARIRLALLEGSADPRRSEVLADLFVMTSDWACYEDLRETAADWPAQLKVLLDRLQENGSLHTCIDILIREDRYDEAVDLAISSGSLRMLDAYGNEFAKKYHEKYYAEYARHVGSLVESARGTEDYEAIRRHVDTMSAIPGHSSQTKKLLAELESKYPQFAEMLIQA